MNPDQLKKWQNWIGDGVTGGSIFHEAMNIELVRNIHVELIDMVANNEELQKPSAFYNVSSFTYGQTLLMFIRRHTETVTNNSNRSLMSLLVEIKNNSDQFTKEYYEGLFIQQVSSSDKAITQAASREFNNHFSEYKSDNLSIKTVEEDITILEEINQSSSTFIDKRLAHLDKQEVAIIPTVKEVEEWCDDILKIIQKYKLLLSAAHFEIKTTLKHDWKAIFRTPWIEE